RRQPHARFHARGAAYQHRPGRRPLLLRRRVGTRDSGGARGRAAGDPARACRTGRRPARHTLAHQAAAPVHARVPEREQPDDDHDPHDVRADAPLGLAFGRARRRVGQRELRAAHRHAGRHDRAHDPPRPARTPGDRGGQGGGARGGPLAVRKPRSDRLAGLRASVAREDDVRGRHPADHEPGGGLEGPDLGRRVGERAGEDREDRRVRRIRPPARRDPRSGLLPPAVLRPGPRRACYDGRVRRGAGGGDAAGGVASRPARRATPGAPAVSQTTTAAQSPATRSRPMRTSILLLLACATAACGADSPARDSLVAVVDTVDGVEHLSYPADPASPLAWRFDTLAVIGGAAVDDENYQFQNARLARNAQGHLFVLDGQGKRILRYDERGSFVQSYGREGGGPGELRMPISIALGPGDSLWVPDMMNRRITIFDPVGAGSRIIGGAADRGMNVSDVSLAGGSYYRTAEAFVPRASAD